MPSTNETTHSNGLQRRRLKITGRVQGVGFRPFVYRLARQFELDGTVCNGSSGVTVDVQGPCGRLEAFQQSLTSQPPPPARIESLAVELLPTNGCRGFTIVKSVDEPAASRTVTPDLAMCEDCRREVRDPANRRYRYPFTNCTNCGPRYTIVTGLPYDRERTTMREFAMCTACRAEYEDPSNRRFHAQPNACPECGPRVTLIDNRGGRLAEHHDALRQAVTALRDGKILALKGLGGFQLLVNATSEQAVRRLRERKVRPEKPLAVMYPSTALIKQHCRLSAAEQTCLESPITPIVLLSMHQAPSSISQLPVDSVSCGVGTLGVMLPYTPLHMLLLDKLNVPVVATSGNRSGDPICFRNDEALQLLGDIADVFLMHDRPIVRPVDDSVIRVVNEQPMVIRLARGLAPFVLSIPTGDSHLIGMGGHMKNAFALATGNRLILSQHIGDLDTPRARENYRTSIKDLSELLDASPDAVACDMHPDYYATGMAGEFGNPFQVQHHVAHVMTAIAEHELGGPVLGFSWDGTGLGEDGTIWGGEVFAVETSTYEHVATLRQFGLPGGDKAVRDPRWAAAGVLHRCYGNEWVRHVPSHIRESFADGQLDTIGKMLARGINSPATSSMGRLFDAVAALLGIFVRENTYEGQAAMMLEAAAAGGTEREPLPFDCVGSDPLIIDWKETILELLRRRNHGVSIENMARSFHITLADIVVEVAMRHGISTVVLSGGCFQNSTLLELCSKRLTDSGFTARWPQRVPLNDGGLAIGQVQAAMRSMRRKE